jgi:glycosyl transferase family 25
VKVGPDNAKRKGRMKMENELQEFFRSLNNFFDKIYVITLRRATERHEHFTKELEGLNYTVFYGQDKLEFDVEELKKKGIYNETLAKEHHRWNKPMPAGMIGCSWSHKLIYQDVIKNNYQRVFIMEDDIVVDKNYISVFSKAINELPKDWELLYLGYERYEELTFSARIKKMIYHVQRLFGGTRFTHKTIKNLYPKKVSAHIYTAGYHDHTHAYAITKSGAEKLDQLQTPISFFPDNLLAYAITNEIVKGYIIKPKLINQQSQGDVKQMGTYIGD